MFGTILGFLTGIPSLIGNYFGFKKAGIQLSIIKDVISEVEKQAPVVEQAIKTAGDVSTAVAAVSTAVSNEQVAAQKALAIQPGSFFANNVRPAITLMFALLIIGQAIGLIGLKLSPDELNWMYTIVGSYMGLTAGGRTLEKIVGIVASYQLAKTVTKSFSSRDE